MKKSPRKLLSVYLVLSATTAIGLWVYQRFVVSLAIWQASQHDVAVSIETILNVLPIASVIMFVWLVGTTSVIVTAVIQRQQARHLAEVREQAELRERQTHELIQTRDAIVFGLSRLAESRDRDTAHHLERISQYAMCLANELARQPQFAERVSRGFVRTIGISAVLHDIGKVSTPDAILLKPGPLTPDERLHMQSHAQAGAECIADIERQLGNSNFLEMAREIALSHHERWDGSGYPRGLSEHAIPLAARIVSIADVYDALAVKRVYKPALPHEQCVDMIRQQSGQAFDPDLVAAFLKVESRFREISIRFREDEGLAPPGRESIGTPIDTIGAATGSDAGNDFVLAESTLVAAGSTVARSMNSPENSRENSQEKLP